MASFFVFLTIFETYENTTDFTREYMKDRGERYEDIINYRRNINNGN